MALNSKEYWQKRSEATLIANESRIIEYEKELRSAYTLTINKINTELDSFFQRYSTETGLDYNEVRKRLTPDEIKDFKTIQAEYIKEAETYGADPKYKAYLKELSGKAYVTRIQELEANIRHEIERLNGGFNGNLGNQLTYSYEDSFYRTIFDVQKQAGLGISFTTPGQKQLIKAIETPWLGGSYSDRIWENKDKLLTTLGQLIPQEFVRGRGSKEIAKDIEQRLGVSYSNAVRLARTELNYVSNQGTLKAYKESGVVDKYEFLATLDNRTSEICRELDGKVFDLSKATVGVNHPPMHPYCRSTTIPYFPDDEFGNYIEDRVARNADGKTYKVGKDTTYKEWAKEHASDAYYKRITKSNNSTTTPHIMQQFDRYQAVLKELAPKTLEEFISIKQNDPERWETLKYQYRTLNRYEIPEEVPVDVVLQLDKINWDTRQNGFSRENLTADEYRTIKRSGNTATMKVDKQLYFSHSRVAYSNETAYKNYKGEPTYILKKEEPAFSYLYLNDNMDRSYDTEARFFEYLNQTLPKDSKSYITIVSEKHICDSCSHVLKQFQQRFPDVTVNIVSGKLGYNKDAAGRKTYKYRK